MKFLRDFSFKNKRTLVRAGFNVSLKDGQIVSDFRIRAALPTIKHLIQEKAKVILLSHLGRPKDSEEQYSLRVVSQRLSKLLGQEVGFLNDCIGQEVEKKVKDLKPGQVILLENLRYYNQEKENDPEFAKKLAQLGEIYVNDAFGVIHRAHASIVGLPEHLPSCAGMLLEKEIKNLSKVLDEPEHPLTVIIGGIKISTKIEVIKKFLENVDHLILAGALANTVISAKGIAIGKSIVEKRWLKKLKG